jgi:hypothetical protein
MIKNKLIRFRIGNRYQFIDISSLKLNFKIIIQ